MPKKNGFVYVYFAGHITSLLEKVQSTGKPDKLTITYVQNNWLLRDAKYSAVLELLRAMGFLDKSGVPTDLYSEYQNITKAKEALAKGVVAAYPTLFKTYPQAHKLPIEQLEGFIKQHTGAEKSIVKKIGNTITTICNMAFEPGEQPPIAQASPSQGNVVVQTSPLRVNPNLQLNIELHISADMPDEKIESIFRNMKKYLLSNNE